MCNTTTGDSGIYHALQERCNLRAAQFLPAQPEGDAANVELRVPLLNRGKNIRLFGLEYLDPAGVIRLNDKYAPREVFYARVGGGVHILRERGGIVLRAVPGFRKKIAPRGKQGGGALGGLEKLVSKAFLEKLSNYIANFFHIPPPTLLNPPTPLINPPNSANKTATPAAVRRY